MCKTVCVFAFVLVSAIAIHGAPQAAAPRPATEEEIKASIAQVQSCWTTNKDNAKFDACLLQLWKEKMPLLVGGIKSMNIPPMDPMTIDNIKFSEQAAVVQVTATFSNVIVHGLKDHVPKSVNVDPKTKTLKLSLSIPKLDVRGNYDIDGTILLLPVKGKGPFTLNLTNIEGNGVALLTREGDKVKLGTLDITFTVQGIKVHLDNLLGEPSVGEAINNMLNDNSQQIFEDIKPKVQKQLGDTILATIGGQFLNLPTEVVGV